MKNIHQNTSNEQNKLIYNNVSDKNTRIAPKNRIKCVLIGDGAVGKTSLVISYTTNSFPTEYIPTAYDNYNVEVYVDGNPIRLQLCDTAGQDDFDSIRPLCYSGTDVFIVCFSVVSPASLENAATKWIPEIKQHCPDACILLVGTQSDLRADVKVLIRLARNGERPVSELEARRLATQKGANAYVECSAITERNLKEVFDQAILSVLKQQQQQQQQQLQNLNNNNKKYHPIQTNNVRIINNKKRKAASIWRKLCCCL